MTNKSKQLGTAGETGVVRYLRTDGFPHAERRALAGSYDLGDITGTPGVCWEVKSGKAAEACTPSDLAEWVRQTVEEKANSRSDVAVLVTKRKACSPASAGLWWAWMPVSQCATLAGCAKRWRAPDPWVRMTLTEAVALLRHGGYGTALTYTEGKVAA
jgi:hypothetical protein